MITKRDRIKLLSGLGIGILAPQLAPHMALASAPPKKTGNDAYTRMPMLTIATRQVGRRRGTMTIESGLFADAPKIAERIQIMMPRLTDGFITALQPYAQTLTASSLVDTDFVSKQLQTTTDTILGQKGARVLLGSIVLN